MLFREMCLLFNLRLMRETQFLPWRWQDVATIYFFEDFDVPEFQKCRTPLCP